MNDCQGSGQLTGCRLAGTCACPYVEAVTDDRTRGRFAQWLWRPPRPHGETIPGRTVSFLELFYDLVYVAVIGQAAHHLAEHVTLRGTAEFGVVFALIWIAWVNASLYLELHGREDGRTRLVVFVQMGVLVLLAVYTADAADSSGRPFALVYAAFLAVLTWLWYSVRRQDQWGHTEFVAPAGRYVAGMSVGVAAILVSAFLPAEARLVVWACAALGWLVGMALAGRSEGRLYWAVPPSDSLVERIGLFTIIVLGEVVFGVVDGLSAHDRDTKTMSTGLIALVIGFGFWWIYFDLVGRRLPRRDSAPLARWLLSHLPMTLSITAAGAAMVSLIGHAHDARTPASTAWLLSGAVALGLMALIAIERALADAERLAVVYRPLSPALAAGAGAALLVGWARPAPWLLALLLVAVLSVVWFFAVARFLRADAWGEEPRREESPAPQPETGDTPRPPTRREGL
jgi:low temperature requirement protein LtrA